MLKKTIGLVLPALAAGALLAGCSGSAQGHGDMPGMGTGSSSVSVPVPQGDHNQADVTFASR
jgi:predicted small secreted protein